MTAIGGPQLVAEIITVSDGPYTLMQEPQAGYAWVPKLIDSARTSVRMTMYELFDSGVERSLIQAQRRGLQVQVILDAAFHGRKANQKAFDQLSGAGAAVVWAPSGRIVHQKSLVIDDSTAVISTANLTEKHYPTGRDALIQDTASDDVTAISATFDADYAAAGTGRLGQASTAQNLIWSPAARRTFLAAIDSAQSSIMLTSEELKDRPTAIVLSHAASRGVDCKIILNADAQHTQAVGDVETAGCHVHIVPKTVHGLYMHEKILLTDHDSLIIGSQNLSTMSLIENRELSLHITGTKAPKVLAAVQQQFESDYTQTEPA